MKSSHSYLVVQPTILQRIAKWNETKGIARMKEFLEGKYRGPFEH